MSATLRKGTNSTVDVTKKMYYFLTLAQIALSHAVQLKLQQPAQEDGEAAHTLSHDRKHEKTFEALSISRITAQSVSCVK